MNLLWKVFVYFFSVPTLALSWIICFPLAKLRGGEHVQEGRAAWAQLLKILAHIADRRTIIIDLIVAWMDEAARVINKEAGR